MPEPMPPQSDRRLLLAGAAAFLALLFAAYSNHFQNSMHFDDWHTVSNNPYIRDLSNIPKFFTDGRTFSALPSNQSYRPLVTTSLAIDCKLAGGATTPLQMQWFHASTFFWYLVLLGCVYLLFARITNPPVALFATAVYGLHPVCAETVNYIIQRGDVYSTLGAVAGLVLYIYFPAARKTGAYLAPVVIGSLAKPPALMFLPILFVYLMLFENADAERTQWRGALLKCVPAGVVCLLAGLLGVVMTPKTFRTGGGDTLQYWMTQPIVILHYVKSFFLPTELSADTDRALVTNVFSEPSVIGLAFLALLAWMIVRYWRERPIAFGLLWFVIALAPTSLTPLAEVENDHRMFFPYVGLTIAVCWAAKRIIESNRIARIFAPIAAAVTLLACTVGTYQRNEVWHTEETLWRDVAEKSPRNGRGLMNYGLTLMNRGDYAGALDYFHRAELYTPNYSTLKLNEGIAYAGSGDQVQAEAYFRRALQLAPADAQPLYFYARWLGQHGRLPEAAALLQQAIQANPALMEARYLLMQAYSDQGDSIRLSALAHDTLRLFPTDQTAAAFAKNGPRPVAQAMLMPSPSGMPAAQATPPNSPASQGSAPAGAPVNRQQPTAEDYLNLSLTLEQSGKHAECIAAAEQALKIRPGYAEAYNNIAAANESLGRWDEAIHAAEKALELKPDFQLARNNLQYSLNQKRIQSVLPRK